MGNFVLQYFNLSPHPFLITHFEYLWFCLLSLFLLSLFFYCHFFDDGLWRAQQAVLPIVTFLMMVCGVHSRPYCILWSLFSTWYLHARVHVPGAVKVCKAGTSLPSFRHGSYVPTPGALCVLCGSISCKFILFGFLLTVATCHGLVQRRSDTVELC